MDMEKKGRLKKLLHPEQIRALLKDFASLLGPEVSLAVSDGSDHLLKSHRSFPREVTDALQKAMPAGRPSRAAEAAQVMITHQSAATPIYAGGEQVGLILAAGPLPPPARTETALRALKHALELLVEVTLEKRATARETLDRYREINLLYNLGETLATCLDVDELLQRVLTEASQIIQAHQGAVLLYNEAGELVTAASTGTGKELETIAVEGRTLAEAVARTGKPRIANDFDVFGDGDQQNPLMAVPLITSERRLGAILLTGKAKGAIFTASDEKLLSALAWQASIALENARLFDSVRRQRDEIATMKRYMDNIFASIASGVITTDTHDVITTFNRAAETILLIPAQQAVNRPYRQVLRFLRSTALPSLIEDVRIHRKTYVDQEICSYLPQGEQRHLNVSLSTLQGGGGETLGVAIVVDDVTEKRRYEQERALVSRYLPSGLVDRLPDDLAELGLRGERQVITSLFADIQGFTGFSEVNPPERVMEILNNYLTLAGAAIRFNHGIVDKYMGDAVMALFNTPLLEEEEHAWRAVQAAWSLKKAVETHHHHIAPEERLLLGIGVCTGEAVVGNVGTEDRMEYTAIGDTVNLARRLQENTRPGQILISHLTWEMVKDQVQVNPLPAMRVKGRQTPIRAYEVIDLIADK
jgi:adenylate cyclase